MTDTRISESPSPIFILSCERAGSTLLRYIVDTHPEICSPGELHLGHLCEDLGHVADLLSIGEVAGSSSSDDRLTRVNAEVRRMVTELMSTYARSKGKRMWCEKTPRNLGYLDVLDSVFPDAKYICLHRNCMDVVHSCLEASKVGFFVDISYYARNIPSTYARTAFGHASVFADSWADKTATILAFEREHPEQCFSLKYESLVTNPETTLRPMFEFLGVEWDEKILDAVFKTKHDQGPGDKKVMYSRKVHTKYMGQGSGVSRRLLSREVLQKVNALLEELRYPIVGPDWDTSPSPYLLAVSRNGDDTAMEVAKVEEVFTDHFPRRLKDRSDSLKEFGETYKFVVTGDDGGTWLLDLSKPGGEIRAEDGEANCVITISSDDLVAMVNGTLNAAIAFEQGKFRVAGNLRQAMGMGQLLLGG
ncbi:MAG TPA: sulfotransferase [Pyrinomonadaceae bacterium]|nr:sulfotransferase [Pyrinomonadaceae bacterium]